jgi:ATP-dependent DNA ligase
VSKPPVGLQWIHEIKHDGYRLIAREQDDRVRLFTRRAYHDQAFLYAFDLLEFDGEN